MDPLMFLGGAVFNGLAGGLSAASAPKLDPSKAARGAFTNSFGEVGDVAARRAQDAYDNLGNTAGARLAANNLNMAGASALGGVQSTTDAAAQAALMNYGNTRRNAFDMAKYSGGSPAAIAGIASKLGDQNSQTVSTLAGQGSDATARALGIASQNYGQAQSVLQGDLSQQHSIAHDKLADFNPAMFQANMDAQNRPTFWQGAGQGLATGLASIGSRMTGGAMSGMMSDKAMKQAQEGVFTPEAWSRFMQHQGFLPKMPSTPTTTAGGALGFIGR